MKQHLEQKGPSQESNGKRFLWIIIGILALLLIEDAHDLIRVSFNSIHISTYIGKALTYNVILTRSQLLGFVSYQICIAGDSYRIEFRDDGTLKSGEGDLICASDDTVKGSISCKSAGSNDGIIIQVRALEPNPEFPEERRAGVNILMSQGRIFLHLNGLLLSDVSTPDDLSGNDLPQNPTRKIP